MPSPSGQEHAEDAGVKQQAAVKQPGSKLATVLAKLLEAGRQKLLLPNYAVSEITCINFRFMCIMGMLMNIQREQSKTMYTDRVPDVVFKTRVRDESVAGPNPFRWQDRTTQEVFGGKRVVLFALPGAFTPTCSSTHLPRYEELYDEIKALGIDEVICLSVNDAFVMFQWGKHQKVENIFLLPDGSGEFTRKMGMLVEKDNLGFGMRSWRYSMVVNDGTIEKMFVEPGFADNAPDDPFKVSDADTMLNYLKSAK